MPTRDFTLNGLTFDFQITTKRHGNEALQVAGHAPLKVVRAVLHELADTVQPAPLVSKWDIRFPNAGDVAGAWEGPNGHRCPASALTTDPGHPDRAAILRCAARCELQSRLNANKS